MFPQTGQSSRHEPLPLPSLLLWLLAPTSLTQLGLMASAFANVCANGSSASPWLWAPWRLLCGQPWVVLCAASALVSWTAKTTSWLKDGAAGTASSMAPKTRTFLELKTCLEKSYWHSRCCIAMWKLLRKHWSGFSMCLTSNASLRLLLFLILGGNSL